MQEVGSVWRVRNMRKSCPRCSQNRLFQKHAQIKEEQFNALPEKHMPPGIRHKARKKISRLKYVKTKEWQIRC